MGYILVARAPMHRLGYGRHQNRGILSLDREWGKCMGLVVLPRARVRITYPFGYGQRTRELVFPSNDSSVSTIYLENM